jgi:hypothetical protein
LDINRNYNFKHLCSHTSATPARWWLHSSTNKFFMNSRILYQCSWRLPNLIPVLLEATEPCTGAPRGSRTLHQRSQMLQNLAPVLPEVSEPCTSAPRGFRTLHQWSWSLQNLAPVPREASRGSQRLCGVRHSKSTSTTSGGSWGFRVRMIDFADVSFNTKP